MKKAAAKLKILEDILSGYKGAVIAFSGGVDSSFLACVAGRVLPGKALAITANSEIFPEDEIKSAASLAQYFGLPHMVVNTKELENDIFTANPKRRCYFCKKELFARLLQIAAKHGLPHVFDGSNYDDCLDYRPGMEAAKELGIKSPLLEAKITKEDIRVLAREIGIPNWDKPAQPCLASRFPYGEVITGEKLSMVKEAEAYLRLFGFDSLRVRHHGNLARIEINPRDFHKIIKQANEISEKLRQTGYSYITLDLQGFRSGSLNEG